MFNFCLKFLNISSFSFFLNLFIFWGLNIYFTVSISLKITITIIFLLNFFYICYLFNINKNKFFFFIILLCFSIFFRFFEYNFFLYISEFNKNIIFNWAIVLICSFIIKLPAYNTLFNLNAFKKVNKRKKVIFFSPSIEGGGAEKNLKLLFQYLNKNKKNYEAIMVLWKKPPAKWLEKKLIVLNSDSTKFSILKIIKILLAEKPDFIFSSLNHLNIFLVIINIIFPQKINIILRESNFLSLKLKDENKNFLQFFLRKKLTTITYNYADKIICPSKEILDDLKNNFNIYKNKLIFIPNLFESNLKKKVIPKNKNFFLAIGRLENQKNYDFLIDAFYQSLKIKKNYLLIIGNGSKKKKLLDKIKKLKIKKFIKILNFKTNLNYYFLNAKGYLMTSKYEGMPNSLIEATSYGLNCIVTNFVGVSYFKKFENIKIVKNFNPMLFAKSIVSFNTKKKIPKMIEVFTSNKNYKKYEKIFK